MGKVGRPKKEDSTCESVSLRLRKEDADKLNYLIATTNRSKTEIFLNGLRMTYNLAKYKT